MYKSKFDIEYIHEDSSSVKGCMFIIHGFSITTHCMKRMCKSFFDEGYDVFCPCLPGHGDHPIHINDVKYQDWFDLIDESYARLRPKYKNFYVGGLCMGASLSVYMAEQYQDIDGVLCLSPLLALDGWAIPKGMPILHFILQTIIKYSYAYPQRSPFRVKNKRIRSVARKTIFETDLMMDRFMTVGIGEVFKAAKVIKKNIKKVTSPLLMVHSIEDDLVSIKGANFIYNNISSESKEFVTVYNSYHVVIDDNDRDLVNKKCVDFINNLNSKQKETI